MAKFNKSSSLTYGFKFYNINVYFCMCSTLFNIIVVNVENANIEIYYYTFKPWSK